MTAVNRWTTAYPDWSGQRGNVEVLPAAEYDRIRAAFALAAEDDAGREELLRELFAAIQPILAEYAKRDPIGDSDLYDEQPVHITVTLGDLRRLARIRT